MEFRGCIICLEPCPSKRCEVIKDKDSVTHTGHNDELNVLFVLKKVLNIPSELIEKNLKKYGNPSEWGISVCGVCQQTYLERAKVLHGEATRVELRFKTLRDEVMEHVQTSKIKADAGFVGVPAVPVKGRGKRKLANNIPGPVFEEIRNWVFQNDGSSKKTAEAIMEAAGGIENYVAQLTAEKSFKVLGPGRKLTDSDSSKAGSSSAMMGGTVSSRDLIHQQPNCSNNQSRPELQSSQSTSTSITDNNAPCQPQNSTNLKSNHTSTEDLIGSLKTLPDEKKAAAAAALARFEKAKKPTVDPKEMLASRQCAFIKEQVRKELEAENSGGDVDASAKHIGASNGHIAEVVPVVKVIDPACYAVQGVFYTCPRIGCHTPLPKPQIETKIKEFLLKRYKDPEVDQYEVPCQMIHSCNASKEAVDACVDLLCKYLDKIIQFPTDVKYRTIRCGNKTFHEKVAIIFGGEQFLKAAAFEKVSMKNPDTFSQLEEDYWEFNPEDETGFGAELIALRDLLKSTKPIKPVLDRNVQVLQPQQATTRTQFPDEFYNLSKEEMKREQELKTDIVEKELTLRTKEMRERDEMREQRKYKFGVIRVRFPDSKILQGTFSANDKLSTLFHFVTEYLISSELEDFELIQPGGQNLSRKSSDMNASLGDLKLLPSSILNFQMDNTPQALVSGEIDFLSIS